LQSVPRYALTRAEAAASLGISLNHFERKVQPELKVVLSGQLVLIPASELERWLQRNARRIVPRATGVGPLRATDMRCGGRPRRPRPAAAAASPSA
jgi:excisionase family DNA binding protein